MKQTYFYLSLIMAIIMIAICPTKALAGTSHVHIIEAHEPVAATCWQEGNTAYWSCSECGKYFSDAECTTEIAENSWVTAVDPNNHNYGYYPDGDYEHHTICCANGCGMEVQGVCVDADNDKVCDLCEQSLVPTEVSFCVTTDTYDIVAIDELYVNGEKVNETQSFPITVQNGDIIKVVATNLESHGRYFQGWYSDDKNTLLSQDRTYEFTITKDTEILNKYVELHKNANGALSTSSAVFTEQAISVPVDYVVQSVTVDRNFTQNTPSTVMFPFNMTYEQWLNNYQLYELEQVVNIEGCFEIVFNNAIMQAASAPSPTFVIMRAPRRAPSTPDPQTVVLKAYQPYIIIPKEGNTTFDINGSVTFKKTEGADISVTKDGWKFVSLNSYKEWKEGDPELGKAYGFAGEAREGIAVGDFVKLAAGASAKAGHCYLVKDTSSSPANGRDGSFFTEEELPETIAVRFVSGETTGISSLNTKTGEMSPVVWYDLNGRRIDEPTKSGIYIKNDKKVQIK